MGVSRYNSEGYPDPTTYGALSNIEQETKAPRALQTDGVCMLSVFRDVAGNIANARKYSRYAVEQGLHSHCSAFACFRSFLTITI